VWKKELKKGQCVVLVLVHVMEEYKEHGIGWFFPQNNFSRK